MESMRLFTVFLDFINQVDEKQILQECYLSQMDDSLIQTI